MSQNENIFVSQKKNRLAIHFPSRLENINRVEAETQRFLQNCDFDEDEIFPIRLVMREGLLNAVKHGNDCDPYKMVKYFLHWQDDILTMEIEDEGPGFDWRSVQHSPPPHDAEHGRGMYIMRRYFSDLQYNESGNQLILRKYSPRVKPRESDQDAALEQLAQSLLKSPEKITQVDRAELFQLIESLYVQRNKVELLNAEMRRAAVWRDNPDRSGQERSGDHSEDRYRALFENNPIETITVDHQGRITEYNLAKKKAGDRLPEIGTIMYQDYAAKHKIDMYSELMACIQTGRAKEFSGLEYNQKTLQIRISPFSGGAIITSVNITPLKKAERKLVRLATAIEQAQEEIVIIDLDGRIEYANAAFLNRNGFDRPDAIGLNVFKNGPELYNSIYYEEIWEALKKGQPWTGHFSRNQKGERHEVESTISPVRDEAGQIICYVSVSRDLTRETQLEEQLRHAQKMQSIGTLAGGIAHDFNNILGSITINAELMFEDVPEGSDSRYAAEQILMASSRAKDLINQILLFSRETKTEKKSLRISLVVKETLKMLRSMLPSTIRISRHIPEDIGLIYGDPTQIQEVIMNLCNNSAFAMREKGGSLTVAIENVTVPETPDIGEVPAGRYIRLAVRDTGQGITPEIRERIFDPFFTTKQPGEGTGLGLSVTHGIVANHGGVITVDSEYGQWTEFSVYLPEIHSVSPAPLPKRGHPVPCGHESILLVDDEYLMTEVGVKMLQRLGYQTVAVNSGKDALALFAENPSRFDLVITDMTMPHVTGLELAQKLIELRPDLPIILCTGFNQLVTPEKAQAVGIKKFIMKPFEIEKMACAIRDVLEATS